MKEKKSKLFLLLTVLLLSFSFAAQAEGSDADWRAAGPGAQPEKKFEVEKLRTDASAEVLLVVQSNAEEKNATGELYVFTREPEANGKMTAWKEVLSAVPAKLGRGGMGKTKEGDQKTPVGLFTMNTPFGIKEKKEGFPENYLQLTESMYWDGDSSSHTYNQLVDRKTVIAFDPAKSEHLIGIAPYYNYCLNTGYNPTCVKGAGSALFLHCLGPDKENTGGCIAIDENSMIRVLQLYKEKKTQILIANKGTFSAYY